MDNLIFALPLIGVIAGGFRFILGDRGLGAGLMLSAILMMIPISFFQEQQSNQALTMGSSPIGTLTKVRYTSYSGFLGLIPGTNTQVETSKGAYFVQGVFPSKAGAMLAMDTDGNGDKKLCFMGKSSDTDCHYLVAP